MNFTIQELRNTNTYRTAIMSGYKIKYESNNVFLKFSLRKRLKETVQSSEIKTIRQFNEQLKLFMLEINS